MFNPIEWMKEKYAESFCISAVTLMISSSFSVFALAIHINWLFFVFLFAGMFAIVMFVTTFILFVMEENRKQREIEAKKTRRVLNVNQITPHAS